MPETGEMVRINPQPIRRNDDYLHGLPSLAGAAEIAPRLLEAGAVVIGHAYSPMPEGVKKRSVRFTIVRTNKLLVDKTLYIYGDRVKGGAPKRFTKMRVGYERALGGLDFSRNPIGVGMDKDSTARPNIINPKDPKRAVGGYGPIPGKFPRRRRKLGKVNPKELESGIVELPDDFDWEYFQAAPRDQRIVRLRGDEWLMLEGLHPRHARVRVRIPKAKAIARLYQRKRVDAPAEVELVCDTFHIEPDDDRCSLIWRGDFRVGTELAASALVIAGAVQEGPEPIRWPETLEELEAIASPANTGKAMPRRNDDHLYSTALSPGAVGADTSHRKPPPPPPRRRNTPPPPMPPVSVPPPPAWHHVARPSWPEFQAIRDPNVPEPNSGVASAAASSGMAGSGPYPSYPGVASNEVPSYQRPASDWQPQAPPYIAPPPPKTVAPVTTPTGTIPAPPPEDEVLPDPFRPFESTHHLTGDEAGENPLERTDPMAGDDDGEDASEWTQTKVADEEAPE